MPQISVRPEKVDVNSQSSDFSTPSLQAGGLERQELQWEVKPTVESADVAPGEASHNLQDGAALGRQLSSQSPKVQALFQNFEDVSGITTNKSIPEGRFKSGYAKSGDVAFQQEVQNLIDNDTISRNTFVISDTGHDIPVFAQILRNQSLSAQGAFRIPNEEALRDRVQGQAQTWGDEISGAQALNAASGQSGLLFAGVDAHRSRENPVSARSLPEAKTLEENGIKRAVILLEAAPTGTYTINNVSEDLKTYVRSLEASNIQVDFKGIDRRQGGLQGETPYLRELVR